MDKTANQILVHRNGELSDGTKIRVTEYPVQEFSRKEIDSIIRSIMGKSMTEFVHDVHVNQNGQYDDLFMKEGEA